MMPSRGAFGVQSIASYLGNAARRQGVTIAETAEWQQEVANGMDPATPVHLCGWVDHFPARVGLAATFCKPLAQTAPHLMAVAAEDNVYLYKAWKDALGAYPNYVAQQIGDCTSFGSGHAIDLLQCVEIVLGHEATAWLEVCTEAIYGIGREIAGMLGGGDGCYGVAVAKALTDVGSTTRKAVGAYSGQRAKQWGGRGGVPQAVKETLSPFKVKSAALITTLDELDAALSNGYSSAGGFSQGFSMTRDSNGMCRQSGRWGHEVMCAAKRVRDGRREYMLCQSWGRNVPSGPTPEDMPDFGFWISGESMADILGQRDWLTFGGAPDFEVRPLPSTWTYASYI
jgi:hypothetical protein